MLRRILRILRNIILGAILLGILGGIFVYYYWIQPEYKKLKSVAYDKLSTVNIRDMTRLTDTVVYDSRGEELGIINAGHFVYVKIQDISPNLQNAYIAQEDRNFKTHNGVDYKATLRAAISLVKNKGKIRQGGSTITQQLVKNTYLSSERTFTRKFVEMILAQELEKMYSKAEIMELYCNINFYGNNCYGVEAASQYYFAKSAKELTVPEAAVLAGITNAPSRYEPVRHPEECLEKRNQVLASMLECEMISEWEYEDYVNTELVVAKNVQNETDEDYLNAYAFHEAVLRLMGLNGFSFEYLWPNAEAQEDYANRFEESYDFCSKDLRNGGYRIYTSLDPLIQEMVQKELDDGLQQFTELQENGKLALQGAIAVVDNQSGLVIAMVGGRGTEDKYNRAFLSTRQPGSSIKPLLDYAPAMETGKYAPGTLVDDHKFEDGPSNSGGHYHGMVTIREAVNRSLNTVAWQVLEDIGLDYGLSFLEKMHFQGLDWRDRTAKAISIGGFTQGVTPEYMARGYASLARNGEFRNDSCILRIEHEKDGDLTKGQNLGTEQVFHPETAYMMTDVLKDSIRKPYGTGRALALQNGIPCAGKTGTTNSSKDTWFCGYTKNYTMAVWVGYDQPRAMPGVYGATYAGKIWQAAMNRLHEGLEITDWTMPETVVEKQNKKTGITDLISTRNMDSTEEYIGEMPVTESSIESVPESTSAPAETIEIGPGVSMAEIHESSIPETKPMEVLPESKAAETAAAPMERVPETIKETERVPETLAPTTAAPTSGSVVHPVVGEVNEETFEEQPEEEDYDYDYDYDDEYPEMVERNPGFQY